MKLRLASVIRCPVCRGPLALHVFRGDTQTLDATSRRELEERAIEPASVEQLVRDGVLECTDCRAWYPIVERVPVLLDFATPVHAEFAKRHRAELDGLDAEPPQGAPRPGEMLTQRSFSSEWRTVRDDELTFTYTHTEREDFIRIELEGVPEQQDRPALDVGCGYGTEAVLLQRVTGREIFGTDLNLSLLDSGEQVDRLPLVHTMVASLFALPFEQRSFDLVYSHGVLHHTFSTERAFAAVSELATAGGRIAMWVYSNRDFASGLRLRFSAAAERALRPTISRAPGPLQAAAVHALSVPHFVRYRRLGPNRERWHYRNSVHSMRDRWTPRYAHRHDTDEVERWFDRAGFEHEPVDAVAYERRFGYPLIGIGKRGVRR